MLKLKIGLMLLWFMVFFSVLGTIAAVNVNATVNPEDTIQTVVNNASAGDNMTVTDDDGSEYTYTGHMHNDISMNFTTSLGIINPVYTNNGKTTSTFNRGTVASGTTTITTIIDNQTAKSNVIIDTTAPTVTSNDPVDGKVNITLNKVITVTFSEPIKGGTMWIELFNTIGTKILIPITTSINGSVLTINHSALLKNGTHYTLALHTGSVTDLAGNNLMGVSRCFTTSTDGIAPTLSAVDPPNNAMNVARDKVITVTFCEPIKAGSLWIELFNTIGTKILIPITTSISGNVLTINHSVLLVNGTRYTLALHTGSVTDLVGNGLAGVSRCFTTSSDVIAPIVSTTDPVNNAVNVARDKVITVTFNEPIKAGSLWIELFNTIETKTLVPITASISGNVLTINHSVLLVNGTRYTLALHTGSVTDLAGNGLAGVSRCFTTINDVIAPTVTTTDPVNNAVNVSRDKVITVTFSEPIKAGSLWIELFNTIGTKTLIPITTSISNNVLTLNHSVLLVNGTRYTLALHTGSVIDLAGNNLMGISRCFTTLIQIITNINTGNHYFTIQAAINDLLTVDGNVIVVSNGTYIENIVVNKSLTLLSEGDVTVQTANSSRSVFTIDLHGSGSAIQGFKIIGSTCSPGILLDSAQNCTIKGNSLALSNGIFLLNSNYNLLWGNNLDGDNSAGITLNNSINNTIYENNVSRIIDGDGIILQYYSVNNSIFGNDIENNCGSGICILTKSSAQICGNNVKNNGIFISNSANNMIYENYINHEYNGETAISLYNSSAEIHFNQISGKFTYGLKVSNNSTVNATNNWWGTNTVSYIKSTTTPSTNYNIWNKNSTVFYNTWLVLNLKSSVIHVTHNSTSSSEITADITHNNQGEDTSSSGTIPDGLPVNFTTTYGTITPTATTKKGKATVILTSSPSSGATTVTASTYNQTVSKSFRKSFSTIQTAISNYLTVDGDVIVVENGTYTENIYLYKSLTLVSEGNVAVQASNLSNPVFIINSGGSGSLIQGFVISGAVNSYGLLLDGCSNCTINNNTITNNSFGIITNTVKTMNNVIMNNNITNNQEIGLGAWNSDNYVIYQNTITYNGYGGIVLFDSNNNIVHTNLIMSNDGPGIFISNLNNTVIQNNLIPGNVYGLYMEYCRNSTVYGNLIAQGIVGMYVNSSVVNINFNRIASNSQYELISENGNINATNNWWGSNSNPVNLGEIVFTGYVNYNPWLMLSIDPSSTVNSGGNASITADLTHNNLGQDTSSLGHVIKGLPITFGTNYGTILTPALTFNGKAVALLNLGTTASRMVTVNASLDCQTVSRQMTIAPGSAVLNITSSALNSTTLQPISFTYNVPLNSSVNWISVLWKNTYVFYGELQVILDGNVVSSTEYVNPAFNTWKTTYPEKVFSAIRFANNWLPQLGLDPNDIPNFWNDTATRYNLTSTQLQFVQNHRMEFIDNLTVNLSYPGVLAPAMTITDPQTNSTINLNFTGNVINRRSQILYMDGSLTTAGYEGVKSFAIATTRVTDSIAQYWADQKNATDINGNLRYPAGAMKAAYGTFFTALMMIYCHDILADTAASEFNVTWSRTHPVAVSVGDDAYQTYLTLECDHSMGMTVIGSLKNITHFNSVCSSQISTIECGIMRNLDFTSQYETVSMDVMGSVLRDISYAFWTGTDLEVFISKGITVMKLVGRSDLILLYDPETGIMRDINTLNGFCGAYCFHDHITELSYDFFDMIINTKIEITINLKSALAVYNLDLLAVAAIIGAFGPDEAFAAAGLTSEQIAIIQASNWYVLSRISNILAPLGLAVSILQSTLQDEINQVWQHPVLEVKVNGRFVYTQIHGYSNIV